MIWPFRRRARLVAVPPPDVSAELLARVERLERQRRATDAKVEGISAIFGELFERAKLRPVDLQDTAEMPPLSVVRDERDSA